MAIIKVKNKMHKKGMFLTFISIAIIAAVIIIFNPTSVDLKKDTLSVKARVSNVNDYVFDLEKVYLENTLKATGRRTVIALIDYMGEETVRAGSEVFLTNFRDAFSEVLLDGKIGGNNIDDSIEPDIMTGNTFNNLKDKIASTAEKAFNVQTKFDEIALADIRVYQTQPWFLTVEADVSFKVTTAEETASWERKSTIITGISIENLIDPYYLVKTNGNYENKIRKSGTSFGEWDVDKIKDFIRDGKYTQFQDRKAPNFISRFIDDVTPSDCCGIESLVDPNKLATLELDRDRDVSYSDYLFWSTAEDCADPPFILDKVNAIDVDFQNFKLDLGHITKYGLSADEQLCPPLP